MNKSEFITPVKNILSSYNKYKKQELFNQFGEYQYYYAYHKNLRTIIKRKRISDTNEEEFINVHNYPRLDETEIKSFAISYTKKLMAYQVILESGHWRVRFKYVNGTEIYDEFDFDVSSDYAFVLNDTGFIYSNNSYNNTINGIKYYDTSSQSLYFHKFGTHERNDIEIFRNNISEDSDVTAKVSDDGNYLFVTLYNALNSTSALYFYNLKNVHDFKSKIELNHLIGNFDANYELYSSVGDMAIIYTNKFSYSGRIVLVKIQNSHQNVDNAEIFMKEEKDLYIKNFFSVGQEFLVLLCIKNSQSFFKLYNKNSQKWMKDIYVGEGFIEHAQGDTSHYNLHFLFNNIYTPTSIYKINFESAKKQRVNELKPEIVIKSNFENLDTSDFVIKKEYYKTKGCKSIPMIMFHSKNLKQNKKNPVIVEAYGDLSASWHPLTSLVKMFFVKEFGGIWCIPGIRGIEGLGKKWTLDGKKLKRKNSIDDFIYAIKHLTKQKYTTSSKIAIYGEGEGGLLTTVVSQREPKLIGAVVAKSPLLDTIRYDKLTEVDYIKEDGYGDLEESKYYKNLYSFSPYHQMDKSYTFKKQWPSTLIIHHLHDFTYFVPNTTKYLAKFYELIKKNKKLRYANPMIAYIMNRDNIFDIEGKTDYFDSEIDEFYRMLLFIQQVLDLKFEK
ncbi:Prolyl endopeptidase [Strongyloides ratti]|uniref:Prolyl endopeptidase n=1 Tax=Strongyloides ratti TaxID=34506 RepID=A0A090KQZ9_STRRB|nr:Prolyl endopeptidase [Strongyloides ratti]CEF59954.1 Prolyl endopeptidase [Strongyloides ratti]